MEKERALELALAQIEKQFGKGSVMRLGESAKNNAVEAIPTTMKSASVLSATEIRPSVMNWSAGAPPAGSRN